MQFFISSFFLTLFALSLPVLVLVSFSFSSPFSFLPFFQDFSLSFAFIEHFHEVPKVFIKRRHEHIVRIPI